MSLSNPEASVIIVNYHSSKEVRQCVESLPQKLSVEIIIVDNDEKPVLEKKFRSKFPHVLFLSGHGNVGYSRGNNLGARHAKGKYLFILNPDTLVSPRTISTLVKILKTKKSLGVVAPLLLNSRGKPYPLQGTSELTPLAGIMSLSLINKWWPHNKVSQNYWLKSWDKKTPREVSTVPGTAFMISQKLFWEIGGFDPNIFLFFEEHDLGKRLSSVRKKLLITPQATVTHLWGKSTAKISSKKLQNIFNRSRFYYFKKHYGLIPAALVQAFANLSWHSLSLVTVLFLGLFLRFYKLTSLAPFISDQATDFLKVKSAITEGSLPLLGHQSSIPRLHHGPLYIWLLIPVLFLADFNPLAGTYFASTLGFLAVVATYQLGVRFFNRTTALIAAAVLAASPLAVTHSRLALHPNAVPLFTVIYLWALIRFSQKKLKIFWVVLSFTLLFQFELSTSPLFLLIPITYLLKKKRLKKPAIIWAFIALFIGLLPQIIYDIKFKFQALGVFLVWGTYRLASRVGIFPEHAVSTSSILHVVDKGFEQFQKFLFWRHPGPTAIGLSVILFGVIIVWRKKSFQYRILAIWLIIMVLAFFTLGTVTDISFTSLFVISALILGNSVASIKKAAIKQALIIFFIAVGLYNSQYLLKQQFFVTGQKLPDNPFITYGPPLPDQIRFSQEIISSTTGPLYLRSRAHPSDPSQVDNYRYLIFYLDRRTFSESGTLIWLP